MHEDYFITDLQWLLHAFPGIHCTFRKVCKSNNQHIRRGVGVVELSRRNRRNYWMPS